MSIRNIAPIWVCGCTFLDVVMSGLKGAPSLGQEQWVTGSNICAGGKANQAAAITRLGVECELITKLGKDIGGQLVEGFLHKHNISTSHSFHTKEQLITVALNWGGDRAMVTSGEPCLSALPRLTKETITRPSALITDLEHVYYNLQTLRSEQYEDIIIVGNVGWDDTEEWSLDSLRCLDLCDYFILNDIEIKNYTKKDSIKEAITFLNGFLGGGVTIIVTRGKDGAIALAGDTFIEIPALIIENPVDATGAGDAFTAGFTVGIVLSNTIEASISLGSIVAGLSVQKEGGAGSSPTVEELKAVVANLSDSAGLDLSFLPICDEVKTIEENSDET